LFNLIYSGEGFVWTEEEKSNEEENIKQIFEGLNDKWSQAFADKIEKNFAYSLKKSSLKTEVITFCKQQELLKSQNDFLKIELNYQKKYYDAKSLIDSLAKK
jgi:hypothetical protein